MERAQQTSIVAAATARHAGRVHFDPNVRRFDIILIINELYLLVCVCGNSLELTRWLDLREL